MEHKTEVSSEPEQTETPRLPIRVINLVGPDSYANPCAPPDTITTFDTSRYTPPNLTTVRPWPSYSCEL